MTRGFFPQFLTIFSSISPPKGGRVEHENVWTEVKKIRKNHASGKFRLPAQKDNNLIAKNMLVDYIFRTHFFCIYAKENFKFFMYL